MTSAFADILPGDTVWVVNSRFNGVFEGRVVKAQDGVIAVEVPAKKIDYHFDAETGKSLVGNSTLAFGDDWKVRAISTRKEHLRLHQVVIEAASALQKNPSEEAIRRLKNAVSEWTWFVEMTEDQTALTSASLHIYLEKTGGAHYERRIAELGRA